MDPATNSEGNTPLHLAIISQDAHNDALVHMLIEAKADVNAQNNNGDTPLHLAFRQKLGDKDVPENEEEMENRQKIICLLEAGARINIKNKQGELPFQAASRLVMWHIYIPLAQAIKTKDNSTVSKLLAQGADPNQNILTIPNNTNRADFLLSIALYSRNQTAVCMLLDAGADPTKMEVYESDDPGPMHVIKLRPEAICQKALKLGCIDMAQLLITHIPRPLILKHLHLNNICKTVLLCCRRINPSLPSDVRKLLCFYCIKGPILEEQELCAAKVCAQADFGGVAYPNNIHRAIHDKEKFDSNNLVQYHPIWVQQIHTVIHQRAAKANLTDKGDSNN